MEHSGEARDDYAAGRVRACRHARGRGDDDPGSVPVVSGSARVPHVVLFSARGCHLCDRARETLARLRGELSFELTEIDITGNAELELRYREWLPVVEIDGRRAAVYAVEPETSRRRVRAQSRPSDQTL